MSDTTTEVTARARWMREHNHGQPNPAWSTGENLAVALVLDDPVLLTAEGYTREQAARWLADDLGIAAVETWAHNVRTALETGA